MDEEKKDLPVVGADGVQEPVDPEAEQRKAEQEEREKKQKQKQDRSRRTVIYGMAGAYLIYLAVQMIRLGMGYTIYVGAGVDQHPDLAAVPISGLWLNRSLAWALERPMSRLGSEVLGLLREHLQQLVGSGGWRGARPLRKSAR